MNGKIFPNIFKNGEEVGHRFGTEHGDARLAEVGDALEDGCGCEVTAGVQDATLLVDTLHVDAQQFLKDVEFLVEVEVLATEYPRTAEGGPAYHHCIDAVCIEGHISLVEGVNVTITYNRNMYARVTLHLADECPVSIACVHLRAGPSVNGQPLDATVLQLFGQGGDDELLVVPA